MKNNICYIAFVVLFSLFLSACQATPNDSVIVKKNNLEAKINQSANLDETSSLPVHQMMQYEKEYESGHKIQVNATFMLPETNKVPVISIQEKPFENGKALEQIVRAFASHPIAYEHNMLTKGDIEKEILYYKELLFRAENNLDLYTGEPITGDSTEPVFELSHDVNASTTDQLKKIIEEYEDEYVSAPYDSDLPQTDYSLKDVGGSHQLNLRVIDKNDTISFDFVNWDVGSNLYMKRPEYIESDSPLYTFQSPLNLEENINMESNLIEQYLLDMGIDYMTLTSISYGENYNVYYYVRTYNGLFETFAETYIGTQRLDPNGYPVMDLWKRELVVAVVAQGELVSLEWTNPSQIMKIDNNNVKILPWDTIEQIFKTQIDLLLTTDPALTSKSTHALFAEPTTIHINRVELGLTKLLIQNSNEYKLIPTWSFLGYDSNRVSANTTPGAEVCFVTINAIDGSVIDRGQMY